MKTILVPVDLSAATSRVCAAATDLAKQIGGRILLLHVIAPLPAVSDGYYLFDTGHLAQAMLATEKSSDRRLRALARRLAARCPVETAQVADQPVAAILAKARRSRAAFIVMGSHGHGAMFDLIVGSTTHGVLRQARCPVLVVPMKRR